MTTGRVAAALTALCLLCQPAFGFIKVFPEFDDEPGAATFFWAARHHRRPVHRQHRQRTGVQR